MGVIGRLLSFVRAERNGAKLSDAKTQTTGGYVVTAAHASSAGDDSQPLPNDYVLLIEVQQTGRTVTAGYVDTANAGKAAAGEKRLYSRTTGGAPIAELWLKNEGTVTASNDAVTLTLSPDGAASLSNAAGGITLGADGTVTINGVVITQAGVVTVPSSLTVAGKELADHTHPQAVDSAGDTQQDTGPNQ